VKFQATFTICCCEKISAKFRVAQITLACTALQCSQTCKCLDVSEVAGAAQCRLDNYKWNCLKNVCRFQECFDWQNEFDRSHKQPTWLDAESLPCSSFMFAFGHWTCGTLLAPILGGRLRQGCRPAGPSVFFACGYTPPKMHTCTWPQLPV
jgi:hypothetical protein